MSTDLDAALSGAEQEPVTETQPEPEATPEPVEEAPNEAEPTLEAEPEAQPEPEENPYEKELFGLKAALAETRAELRGLKQVQPKEPAAPPPDMFEDPEGYAKYQASTVQQMQQNLRLDMSEEMARDAYGDETVETAFEAFKQADPAAQAGVMQDRSPWKAMVKWHKQQQVVQEIGDDPQGWIEKQRAQIMAEVSAKMVAEQAKQQSGKPAPSMANVTGTGGGPKSNWTGPTNLDDILGS